MGLTEVVYSIVETSKANDFEPFRYLTYLFEKLPNINFKIHPEVLEDFLPWSKGNYSLANAQGIQDA